MHPGVTGPTDSFLVEKRGNIRSCKEVRMQKLIQFRFSGDSIRFVLAFFKLLKNEELL